MSKFKVGIVYHDMVACSDSEEHQVVTADSEEAARIAGEALLEGVCSCGCGSYDEVGQVRPVE